MAFDGTAPNDNLGRGWGANMPNRVKQGESNCCDLRFETHSANDVILCWTIICKYLQKPEMRKKNMLCLEKIFAIFLPMPYRSRYKEEQISRHVWTKLLQEDKDFICSHITALSYYSCSSWPMAHLSPFPSSPNDSKTYSFKRSACFHQVCQALRP